MITIYHLLDKRKAYKRSKDVPILTDVKYELNDKIEHFRFSYGLTCNPKYWVKGKGDKVRSGEPNSETKNTTLARIKKEAEGIYHEGMLKGSMPTKEAYKARIKDRMKTAAAEKTTLNHLDDYIASLKAKKRSKSFISAMGSLRAALETLNDQGVPIGFQDINGEFETKFRELLSDKAKNTVSAYIKRLKMFLNWAFINNHHHNMIYKSFEMVEESGDIVALTELEVDRIAKLNIPTHKHIKEGGTRLIRDWFIISTQTGLRYSDLATIAEPELVKVQGGYDLHVQTKKTGAKVVIPVSRMLYDVFKSYDFSVPTPPSNQKMNAGLDRIAKLAKLRKNISTHTGRKTFATVQYLRGVPVPQIMKITGHRTEKEFYRYIGVTLSENAAKVRETSQDFIIEHNTKMNVA